MERIESKTTAISSVLRLVILVSLGHFAIDFMLSIWPVYKTMARLDLAKAGLIAAASVVVGELMQLYFGKLIDKGYQRMLLFLGPALAMGAFFFPYVSNYVSFSLLVLATCIGSAAFHPTAASLLTAIDTPKKARLLGYFQMAGNFGMGVGQFLFSKTYDLVLGNTAILALPVFFFLAFVFFSPDLKQVQEKKKEGISLKVIISFFKCPSLRSLYFVQLANQTILWALVFLLPDFLLSKHYPEWICFGGGHFILLLGAALAVVPVSIISEKFAPAKTILVSFLITFALYYSLLSMETAPLPLLFITLFSLGAVLGSMTPLSLALGAEIAPNHRGMVSAFLMGLVWIVSEGIGLGLSGSLAELFQENAPAKALAILGLFLFFGSYISLRLVRYEKVRIDRV